MSKPLEQLSFMVGRWSDGRVEELWLDAVAGRMLGLNRSLESAAFEFLRIELREGGPVYVASPMGQPPTEFALVEADGRRAVFGNPDHDFPTQIRYELVGDELHACASNADHSLRWVWTAQER